VLDVPSYEEQRAPSGFAECSDDEYSAEGGARYGTPSLRLRDADGSRGVEWQYIDHTIDDDRLTVRFYDRHYPVEIRLHYRVLDECGVLERRISVTSHGPAVTLSDVDSAQWTLPPRADFRLSHVVGDWAAETRIERDRIPVAETVLSSRRGATGHHANPWLMVDAGDAGEDHGEVWSAALAWSGSWRIVVRRTADGRVSWTGGASALGDWQLEPGETFRTPVFAAAHTCTGGFGAVSRIWHDYVARHVLPAPHRPRPIVYNSWEATRFAVDQEDQQSLADLAVKAGVEVFVMDDGWFAGRHDDTAGLGDWTPDPERFPHGVEPLAAYVRSLGMGFGIWVEPEMVNRNSRLYREHPEWVLHLPHRHRTELRNQLVLNFARPDVAAWAFDWLSDLVGSLSLDFLKWDMNRPFTEAGWPTSADPSRLWFDHVRAVYDILDRLRAEHPGLHIEGCSGGGGRADLGMLSHVDTLWVSDNTDAVDRLTIQRGYAQVYPARTMSGWVTDSPNPLTRRELPLVFRFHVAMTGVLALGGDLRRWSQRDLDESTELIALYKEIRPVVQHGVARWLPDAVQYTLDDRVVVIAWHLPQNYGRQPQPIRLAGLDPQARYRDEVTGRVHHGAVLLAHGLPWIADPDLERYPPDRPGPGGIAGESLPDERVLPSGTPHSQVTRLTRER
jgi:alpha-galactosidase